VYKSSQKHYILVDNIVTLLPIYYLIVGFIKTIIVDTYVN